MGGGTLPTLRSELASPTVAGAIAIVVVLLLIPVLVMMGGGLASAILGQVLWRDGQVRHEDSELSQLDD